MKKVTQLDALEKIIEVLNDDADAANAEISKRLLVEKTIFIRRDAMKSLKSGVLQKRSPEYKYIKEKALPLPCGTGSAEKFTFSACFCAGWRESCCRPCRRRAAPSGTGTS